MFDMHPTVKLGAGVLVRNHCHIRENAVLGDGVKLGIGCYVGPGVVIEKHSRLQNGAQIFEPARLGPGTFVGPGAVFTNDRTPRSIEASGMPIGPKDWEKKGVVTEVGASIGAGAILVGPVTVGKWAMVAAGAVVVSDVASYALVAGVPARRIGWVGEEGVRLEGGPKEWICPDSKARYVERDGILEPV